MDITIIRTGKTLFRVDECVCIALLEAFPEQFKRYEKPAPKPRGTEYSVISAPMTGKFSIACRKYSPDGRVVEETFYSGNPDKALAAFRDVPVSVVDAYRKAVAGATTVGGAEARREREAAERQRLDDQMRKNREANVGVQQ
ncbi:MAG: hypothetical protein ACHP8B_10870 [Terriglobales bacterium]